jgi:hypothetical protein
MRQATIILRMTEKEWDEHLVLRVMFIWGVSRSSYTLEGDRRLKKVGKHRPTPVVSNMFNHALQYQ